MKMSKILIDRFSLYISAEISASYRYIGVSADTGKVRFGRALVYSKQKCYQIDQGLYKIIK